MTTYKNISIPGVFKRHYPDSRLLDRDLLHALDQDLRIIESILDRGFSMEDNFDGRLISLTTNASPDTEDTTAHTLGKVPTGFIVYSQNKAGSLYDSGTAFDATNIYTKCDVASVAFKIIVF